MADDYIEMETSSKIPVLHRGKEVAVGFNDFGSIQPLDTLLSQYFPKKYGKNIDKNIKELTTNIKKIISLEELQQKNSKKDVQKSALALQEIAKALDKSIEQNKKRDKEDDARTNGVISKILKEVSNMSVDIFKNSMEKLGFLVDLTKSGVTVTQGFDTLEKKSFHLARTTEKLINWFSKNSQTVQRLNARMGDGVTTFTDALDKITGQYALSTEEEEKIVARWYEDRLKFLNQDEILRQQQNSEIEKYTKSLIKLRTATGKSIDTILEESKIREEEFAYERLKKSNPLLEELSNNLKGMGLSPAQVKALITGDVSTVEGIATNNSPFGQMVQPIISQILSGNYKGDMIADLNKAYDVTSTDRNNILQTLSTNRQYSWLMKEAQYQNAQNQLAGIQKLNTVSQTKVDESGFYAARKLRDEETKIKIADKALTSYSIENLTPQLELLNKGLEVFNKGSGWAVDKKSEYASSFWKETAVIFGYNSAKSFASELLQTVGSMVVNATNVTINEMSSGKNKKNRDKNKNNSENSLEKTNNLLSRILYGVAGLAIMAGTAYFGDDIANSLVNQLDSPILNGITQTGIGATGGSVGGALLGYALTDSKIGAFTGAKIGAVTGAGIGAGKAIYQHNETPEMIIPNQPSFDSSSNTSASNASTQNAETQRFNATNQVQKDIKEINSLMLDALERIERGQQRQTQQLENIGFMATSKNTGMI